VSTSSSRHSRRRTATQAFSGEGEGDEADHEGNESPVSGPSRKRARADGGEEAIVIDDLDEEEVGGREAELLKETLQKQREEAVKSQQAANEVPKLSKLQCVICMDSFTDMTATSCGNASPPLPSLYPHFPFLPSKAQH
jgi:hypothetical protein